MKKELLRFSFLCIAVYLSLAACEIFLLGPLVDFVAKGFRTRILAYLILLLIVDPPVTRFIADRFRFSEMKDEGDDLL